MGCEGGDALRRSRGCEGRDASRRGRGVGLGLSASQGSVVGTPWVEGDARFGGRILFGGGDPDATGRHRAGNAWGVVGSVGSTRVGEVEGVHGSSFGSAAKRKVGGSPWAEGGADVCGRFFLRGSPDATGRSASPPPCTLFFLLPPALPAEEAIPSGRRPSLQVQPLPISISQGP